MKLIKMLVLVAAGATFAGCGSSDNTCTDAGCPDGAVIGNLDGGGPDVMYWALSRGTNNYNITKVVTTSDGCMLGQAALMGMNRPVTYDEATTTISVGASQGTNPAQPSFGSGKIAGNMATLVRDNTGGDSTCNWKQVDNNVLTLFANDKFTVDVTETDSMFSAGCTGMNPPPPASGMCTSTYQLTFEKM